MNRARRKEAFGAFGRSVYNLRRLWRCSSHLVAPLFPCTIYRYAVYCQTKKPFIAAKSKQLLTTTSEPTRIFLQPQILEHQNAWLDRSISKKKCERKARPHARQSPCGGRMPPKRGVHTFKSHGSWAASTTPRDMGSSLPPRGSVCPRDNHSLLYHRTPDL